MSCHSAGTYCFSVSKLLVVCVCESGRQSTPPFCPRTNSKSSLSQLVVLSDGETLLLSDGIVSLCSCCMSYLYVVIYTNPKRQREREKERKMFIIYVQNMYLCIGLFVYMFVCLLPRVARIGGLNPQTSSSTIMSCLGISVTGHSYPSLFSSLLFNVLLDLMSFQLHYYNPHSTITRSC